MQHFPIYYMKKKFKVLSQCESFSNLIRPVDMSIFKQIIANKISSKEVKPAEEEFRYLTEDFKNGLIVRSTEVLNDLNINPLKKLNKFEVKEIKFLLYFSTLKIFI